MNIFFVMNFILWLTMSIKPVPISVIRLMLCVKKLHNNSVYICVLRKHWNQVIGFPTETEQVVFFRGKDGLTQQGVF